MPMRPTILQLQEGTLKGGYAANSYVSRVGAVNKSPLGGGTTHLLRRNRFYPGRTCCVYCQGLENKSSEIVHQGAPYLFWYLWLVIVALFPLSRRSTSPLPHRLGPCCSCAVAQYPFLNHCEHGAPISLHPDWLVNKLAGSEFEGSLGIRLV